MSKRIFSHTTKVLAATLVFALVPGALAGCSTQTSVGPAKLKVVTSTSVWGSVVEAIAGDKVDVVSIVNNPNQDPHSFEASVRDQAAVNSADLVMLTGNGYDNFMNPLIAASHQPKDHILALAPNDKKVKTYEGAAISDPHVWYDFDIVGRIAKDITRKLGNADDVNKAAFSKNNSKFQLGLTELKTRLQKSSTIFRGCHSVSIVPGEKLCRYINLTPIFQPESVGLRLIKNFAIDLTPPSLRQAVLNGTDVSAQDMAFAKLIFSGDAIDPKTHYSVLPVQWLVLNSQQSSAQLNQFVAWSKQNRATKILTLSETLPLRETYLQWMTNNIAQIEALRATEMRS